MIGDLPAASGERAGSGPARRPRLREHRRARRAAVVTVSVVAAAAAIAGCGGSSGSAVAAKSPDAILAAATSTVQGVKSVHVAGSVASGLGPLAFDLTLAKGKGGEGQISQNGVGARMVVVGNELYLNGSNAFWSAVGGATVAQLLHGKWLKAPATGMFAQVAQLADLKLLFHTMTENHGKLTKGATSTVDGQKVIALNDTQGGTLYVAATGTPYPVEIAKKGSAGGHVVFDHYNQPVSLSAPANSIDFNKLTGQG